MTATSDQEFYEVITWMVVFGINLILLAFAYWTMDIAALIHKPWRKHTAWLLATVFAGLGIWRTIAIVIYYDSYVARLAIPTSAAFIWGALLLGGYATHKYLLSVHARMHISNENWNLSEAVSRDIVEPLLRGEPVTREKIAEYKTMSAAYKAK